MGNKQSPTNITEIDYNKTENSALANLEIHKHNTENIEIQIIKDLFTNNLANNEEIIIIIEKLKYYLNNKIKLSPNNSKNRDNRIIEKQFKWISESEYFGDLCIIRLLNVLIVLIRNTKALKILEIANSSQNNNKDFDYKNVENLNKYHQSITDMPEEIKQILIKRDIAIECIKRNKIIEYFIELIKSYSNNSKTVDVKYKVTDTQIDTAFLFFHSFISEERLFKNNPLIDKEKLLIVFVDIFNNNNKISCKNKKEHLYCSLYTIKQIINNNKSLKRMFLDKGGYKILLSHVYSEDKLLIRESLLCFEVLLYVSFIKNVINKFIG